MIHRLYGESRKFFGFERTLAERALGAAHEYIVYRRERGDRTEGAGWAAASGRRAKLGKYKHATATWARDYTLDHGPAVRLLIAEVDVWERESLETWAAAGRLTADGRLRVRHEADPAWTLDRIKEAFPRLDEWDLIGALIAADGEIEEDFMIRHQKIRDVLREMIRLEVKKAVPEEMDAVMDRVADDLRAERGPVRPSILTAGAESRPRTR